MTQIKRSARRDETRQKKHIWAARMRRYPTRAEAALKAVLWDRQLGHRFRNQSLISGFIADFWCPKLKLVIEVDGSSHIGREDYDAGRDLCMREKGITVLRFTNEQVLNDLAWVITEISAEIAFLEKKANREGGEAEAPPPSLTG